LFGLLEEIAHLLVEALLAARLALLFLSHLLHALLHLLAHLLHVLHLLALRLAILLGAGHRHEGEEAGCEAECHRPCLHHLMVSCSVTE
jgi:hypothetical protein